jgi:hypothetical protein
MDFPAKATLCEYTGDELTIFNAGYRELTQSEKDIMANAPSKRKENEQQVKNDIMTDASWCYRHDKQYFKENNAEYLEGHKTVRGLYLDFNEHNQNNPLCLRDEKIKGTLELKYKIII